MVSSCRIAILRLPDNYNHRINKSGHAELECTACMRRRADITILATCLELLIIKRSHQ